MVARFIELLVFVGVVVSVGGYAVRSMARPARKAREQALARENARWTVFSDIEEGEIRIGIEKVARAGSWFERLDSEVTATVACDLPTAERDTEVRIAKGDARAYADLLNE